MARNLAAYTPPGSLYPAYLSISLSDDLTAVEVTVRSESHPSKFSPNMSVVGEQAVISIPMNEFAEVLRQISHGFYEEGI